MSSFVKLAAVLALIAGAIAVSPASAQARYWHHGGWGYHHWGWSPAWGLGWGPVYPYYGPYYAGPPPACGYVNVPVWRHRHRIWRRVWRCV